MRGGNFHKMQTSVPSDWLLNALSNRGITVSNICKALAIRETQFDSSNAVLPVDTYNTIFEWAAQQLADPVLGIHISEEMNVEKLGILGYLLSNAATLKDAYELLERYHCIFSPGFSYTFQRKGTDFICYYHPAHPTPDETRQDIDFSVGNMIKGVRRALGPEWSPDHCTFTYSPPDDLSEHHRYFGENLYFDQPHNSYAIAEKLLSTPLTTADPDLFRILKQQADLLLDQISGQQDLVRHVELLLTAGMGHEQLSGEEIARQLNMSRRQLHRLLNERNTSYAKLRDNTMLKVAKEALLTTDSSVTDIAQKLGYSESSAFVRVFKRLEGRTPLQYRKQTRQR